MTTIEEIFNLTKSQLKSKLIEHEDKTHYTNNLERINAVIIHSFNKELLNTKEMEIVESDNYDTVMNSNPKSYSEFLNLLNPRKKSNKINININPQLLKSWNNPKVTTLEGHRYSVNSVAVSGIINTTDGFEKQYIISGSSDKTIKIWDLSTFELVKTLEGHTGDVKCVVVSGVINTTDDFGNNIEKQYIISGSGDETIKIWDLSTFELIKTLEGHRDYVNCVAVSSVFNTTDEFGNNISKQYIISGSEDVTIKIWNLFTFELVATLEEHTYCVESVVVRGINNTADKFGKQYIISGSFDNTIKIWDLSTFKLVETLEGHTNFVTSVAVSSVINTTDEFGNNIGKQYIISGSSDRTIKIWDLSTFKLLKTLEGHTGSIYSIAVSGINNTSNKFEKKYIISGSVDNTIKIWDLSTFKLVTTLEGHNDIVRSVAFNSKYIISGSEDEDTTIKIWEQN